MSDILIKGMEMPQNCGECPFIFSSWGIEYYCHLARASTSAEYVEREKMTNCPLVELPPHGRLGDLDKLNIHDISPVDGFCVMGVTEEDIELADTVIEGSET